MAAKPLGNYFVTSASSQAAGGVTEHNFGNLLIVDDVLYPKGMTPYVGRALHVRLALFVLSQVLPVISAIILVGYRKDWWRTRFRWSMSRLIALWLFTVQVFAIIIFAQEGATDRLTFVSAVLHLQVEFMIIAFLLKYSALASLIFAYIGGTMLFLIVLFVKDLSVVFIAATTFGFTDFIIPLLFVYGKQWLFAAGGLAHLVQAVAVFASIVKNYGVINYSFLIFISTWIMNGALVAAVLASKRKPAAGAIRISDGEVSDSSNETFDPTAQADDNPLANVNISPKTLAILFGISVTGSFVSALVFVFVVAKH